ncbi:MAG: hypothetical protein IPQ05_09195 [Leptospiraceae bacterium]|nr:hypothetical protein [Leptospiraceae bacterium]
MEERVILDLLPFIPFKAIYKLEFITAYVTIAFFFLFIRNLFPEEFSKTILRITLLFSVSSPITGSYSSILIFTALSFSPVLVNI